MPRLDTRFFIDFLGSIIVNDNKPAITIIRSDLDKLETMLNNLATYTAQAEALDEELARAKIIEDDKLKDKVVTMNSKVHCRDDLNNKEYHLTLVYPHQVTDKDTVSVLAPVGSALLGLSVGQQIKWQTTEGKDILLTLLDVEYPS